MAFKFGFLETPSFPEIVVKINEMISTTFGLRDGNRYC
jgi:hypothetical protein